MFVEILGKRWEIKFVKANELRDCYGACDAPDTKGKRILIRKHIRGERKLSTIVHEILHAADWHKDEEWIEKVGNDIARILMKVGYEHKEEREEKGY